MALLRAIDVFSVPTVFRESKGLPVLEAMASAVPVVQPAHSNFPELIEATGGGILFEPDDPQALATAIIELMHDPARRAQLGKRGREVVLESYTDDAMATETAALYADWA